MVIRNKAVSQKISHRLMVSLLATSLIASAGCGGISKKNWKTIGAVIAVGVAAKLIYDMVVDYQSKQINDESVVVNRYKKTHGGLPNEAILLNYQSSIEPGDVVSAGKSVSIKSKLEVVRSESSRHVSIQEKIVIFDNEDNSKELKSLIKTVNEKSNTSGEFENEFTFKLPKGMPQGLYPVQTTVIVNGVAQQPVNNTMQLI